MSYGRFYSWFLLWLGGRVGEEEDEGKMVVGGKERGWILEDRKEKL